MSEHAKSPATAAKNAGAPSFSEFKITDESDDRLR
jgi:hypothetical protein